MRTVLLLLAALFVCVPAYAQSPTIPIDQPFKAEVDHDGVNTTGYRCYADNTQVGTDLALAARVNGVVTCSFPAFSTAATHTIAISAFNTGGEAKSPALTVASVPVTVPPNPPSLPRIINLELSVDAKGKVSGVRVTGVK